MKKAALIIGIILVLIVSVTMVSLSIKKRDNQIIELKNQLFNMAESFNSLDAEKKSLEGKVSKLEDELKEQKNKVTQVTSRSSESRVSKSVNSISWNDLELLARIINAEAGGCTDEHQLFPARRLLLLLRQDVR